MSFSKCIEKKKSNFWQFQKSSFFSSVVSVVFVAFWDTTMLFFQKYDISAFICTKNHQKSFTRSKVMPIWILVATGLLGYVLVLSFLIIKIDVKSSRLNFPADVTRPTKQYQGPTHPIPSPKSHNLDGYTPAPPGYVCNLKLCFEIQKAIFWRTWAFCCFCCVLGYCFCVFSGFWKAGDVATNFYFFLTTST